MFDRAGLFMYRAVTGLHCGAAEGESGLDLPVVRERITRHPIIPASSLKGVWRDYCQTLWKNDDAVQAAFGPKSSDGELAMARPYSGCLGFTDARLLFLPVRASMGTFALLSCPMQMQRFLEARALAKLDISNNGVFDFAAQPKRDELLVFPAKVGPTGAETASVFANAAGKKIFAEELEFSLREDDAVNSVFASDYFKWLPDRLLARMGLVSDDVFQWLAGNCLEVAAHNVLNDTTKSSENLWYEEVVPAESVFFQLVLSGPVHKPGPAGGEDYLQKLAATKPSYFQVGGHETKGRGLMDCGAILPSAPAEQGQ